MKTPVNEESVCILLIPTKEPSTGNFETFFNYRQGFGSGGVRNRRDAPRNPHGDKKFLVKLQVPTIADNPIGILLYDETRAIQR